MKNYRYKLPFKKENKTVDTSNCRAIGPLLKAMQNLKP